MCKLSLLIFFEIVHFNALEIKFVWRILAGILFHLRENQ